MHKHKAIVLTGGFKYRPTNGLNVGDVAQMLHVTQMLKEMYPQFEVVLLANGNNDESIFTDIEVNKDLVNFLAWPSMHYLPRRLKVVLRWSYLYMIAKSGYVASNKNKAAQKIICFFRNANILIVSGGGVLHDGYIHSTALLWCLEIILAAALKVPIVMIGQQIGPLNYKLSQLIIGYTLRKVSFVGVRDEESKITAKSAGCPIDQIFYTGDEGAYLTPSDEVTIADCLKKHKIFGDFIAVQFRIDNNCPLEPYIDMFAKIIESVAVRFHNKQIVFIPFSYADRSDDRESCRLIANRLQMANVILDVNGDPMLTKGILSKATMAFGIANHFCVFAASVGVPTIGFSGSAYMAQKLRGIERVWKHFKMLEISECENIDHVLSTIEDIMIDMTLYLKEKNKTVHNKPKDYYKWTRLIK